MPKGEKNDASSLEPPSKWVIVYKDDEEIDEDEYQEVLEKLKELGKHKKDGDHKER